MKKQRIPFFKRIGVKRFLFIIVRVIVISIISLSLAFIPFTDNDEQRSRLIFNALMAFVLLMLSLLPSIMEKTWKIEIPSFMEVIFLIFSTLAFLFGEIADFYIEYTWWDSMLHTLTGAAIACLGFTIINFVNDNKSFSSFHLGPVFACIFVLCFSLSCGVVWEMIEWLADTINGTNMQRYMDSATGITYEGRRALLDTMKDLFLDGLGAVVITILGYIDIKLHNGRVIEIFKVEKLKQDNKNTGE
ncbi:MAG: hypothetical protein IJA65_05430 [Acholeplasmatales bacterium]|nr:hypothetical protein [Acholeplasmatales bacterium]